MFANNQSRKQDTETRGLTNTYKEKKEMKKRFAGLFGMVSFALLLATTGANAQTLETLHNFLGSNNGDGALPYAGLIQASDGNLYGTTSAGGAYDYGTVFKMSTAGTLIWTYSLPASGTSDGYDPRAGLIQANDGNLYGTAPVGGTYGYGTVFQITPSGALTTLYSFTNGTDGSHPFASLVQASDGYLYGTTSGAAYYPGNGYGTVFKMTTSGTLIWTYPFHYSDGGYPYAGLIQASDGNLYGTTEQGGVQTGNYGTIFQITPSGILTSLYSFGGSDGAYLFASLIQASDGYLYGVTHQGGLSNYGTIFQIPIGTSGALTTVYSFSGGDGSYPDASLIQASDGNLYGTTVGDSANNPYGMVFQIPIGTSGTPTTKFHFHQIDGQFPRASLIQASDGNLYGTTFQSASGYGTVFRLSGIYTVPALSSVSPASRNAAGPDFTLTVKGASFQPFSTVNWNGAPLATTYVSATELKAAVPAALITSPGKASLTVVTGAGGGTSNKKTLTILLTTVNLTSATLTKDSTTGVYTANITFKNVGYLTAPNVTITSATLGAAAASTTLPVTVGDITAGAAGNASLTFPSSAGVSGTKVTLKASGTFTGGKFSGSLKVKLP